MVKVIHSNQQYQNTSIIDEIVAQLVNFLASGMKKSSAETKDLPNLTSN